jgi:alpha-L-fucosidase
MFPKVVQVVPMKDYTVYVYFEDGKIVCYDMKNMLDKEVFKPLKDISVFT